MNRPVLTQNDRLCRCDPVWQKVMARMLAAGGTEIFLEPEGPLAVRALLREGRFFAGESAVPWAMVPNRAHHNAAGLCRAFPRDIRVGIGYALGKDGCWRRHSWGIYGATILETTDLKIWYFGRILDGPETKTFCDREHQPEECVPLPLSLSLHEYVERVRRALVTGDTLLGA